MYTSNIFMLLNLILIMFRMQVNTHDPWVYGPETYKCPVAVSTRASPQGDYVTNCHSLTWYQSQWWFLDMIWLTYEGVCWKHFTCLLKFIKDTFCNELEIETQVKKHTFPNQNLLEVLLFV